LTWELGLAALARASPMQRSPGMGGLGGNQSLVDLNTEKS